LKRELVPKLGAWAAEAPTAVFFDKHHIYYIKAAKVQLGPSERSQLQQSKSLEEDPAPPPGSRSPTKDLAKRRFVEVEDSAREEYP
jgi:hypothetical protein